MDDHLSFGVRKLAVGLKQYLSLFELPSSIWIHFLVINLKFEREKNVGRREGITKKKNATWHLEDFSKKTFL